MTKILYVQPWTCLSNFVAQLLCFSLSNTNRNPLPGLLIIISRTPHSYSEFCCTNHLPLLQLWLCDATPHIPTLTTFFTPTSSTNTLFWLSKSSIALHSQSLFPHFPICSCSTTILYHPQSSLIRSCPSSLAVTYAWTNSKYMEHTMQPLVPPYNPISKGVFWEPFGNPDLTRM